MAHSNIEFQIIVTFLCKDIYIFCLSQTYNKVSLAKEEIFCKEHIFFSTKLIDCQSLSSQIAILTKQCSATKEFLRSCGRDQLTQKTSCTFLKLLTVGSQSLFSLKASSARVSNVIRNTENWQKRACCTCFHFVCIENNALYVFRKQSES